MNFLRQKLSINKLQPKLTITSPGDKYEQEADAMAASVMRMPANSTDFTPKTGLIGASVQRKCASCEEDEKHRPIMRKETSGFGGMEVTDTFSSSLNSTKGGGSLLPKGTRSFMENAFSTDFSNIKIHNNDKANNLSQSINAKAFTHGNDIYFGAGQYSPNSFEGKSLLAHELTHTLQQGRESIRRVPMPEESTIVNLDTYTARTRQNIRFDNAFNFQRGLSRFFQSGIVMTPRIGYNVSLVVRGLAATETWLENALRALMLYNFNLSENETAAAIVNFTSVQNLDLTSQTNPTDTTIAGPNATFRFTSTQFDATGPRGARIQNVQLLVEKLGNFTAPVSTETAAQRKTRYENTYQITKAVPVRNDPLGDPIEAISDAQFDVVLQALDVVPATVLSQAAGIPIHRGLTAVGPEGEAAEYSQTRAPSATTWARRITVYRDFFSAGLPQRTFLMAHEFGHALDFRPNEGGSTGGPSLSSGSAAGSFRRAVTADGGLAKGMSEYSLTTTTYKEYFAEAFTMYINQRATLQSLRPNVYAYFLTTYP